VASRRRRKKVLKLAKGYWGSRSKIYTVAKHSVDRAFQFQYRDRRQRKRQFRRLWIARINAAARDNGTTYSRLISDMRVKGIELNRKVLADLAVHHPEAFTKIVETASD
jgi:large subunit ribosomal protein L20